MLESLKVIALLCQISAGAGTVYPSSVVRIINNTQLRCHKYFVQCLKDKKRINECILERKEK